jgi:hypothetical protein
MNLLYISFGNNAAIHLQTAFSIYSFLTQNDSINSINIVTDDAAFYQHLNSQVNIIQVTQNDLTEWKGPHQFFWRIKLKAIEKICQLYPNDPVLYIDCDTYLYGHLDGLKNKLLNGIALLHENEGELSGKKNKTQKRMWQQVKGKLFCNIAMQASDCMWNSGVIGIPNTKNGRDCELILAICDEMCSKNITRYFIEQYSLSLALEKTYGLAEAKSAIVHYWSTKDIWDKQITNFFMRAYFADWSYEKILEEMRSFDTTNLPFFQRVKNTNIRLKALIDKTFPNKELKYLPKT